MYRLKHTDVAYDRRSNKMPWTNYTSCNVQADTVTCFTSDGLADRTLYVRYERLSTVPYSPWMFSACLKSCAPNVDVPRSMPLRFLDFPRCTSAATHHAIIGVVRAESEVSRLVLNCAIVSDSFNIFANHIFVWTMSHFTCRTAPIHS